MPLGGERWKSFCLPDGSEEFSQRNELAGGECICDILHQHGGRLVGGGVQTERMGLDGKRLWNCGDALRGCEN
jgi:hypothetical protein